MTTPCPCFGRNENCNLCGGSGMVSAAIEAKAVRSAAQRLNPYFAGHSDEQNLTKCADRNPKSSTEQAADEAAQSAKSVAYWNKRWGKS